MFKVIASLLAAIVLLAPAAGFATAQVTLHGPQAGGGLTGATIGTATTPTIKDSGLTARPSPISAESAGLSGLITAQNDARARLGLPALTWSAALAIEADATVKTAVAGACTQSASLKAGETRSASIYWAAALPRMGGQWAAQEISPAYPVIQWREGKNDYDLAKAQCRSRGGSCEPYSHMVAPKAKFVGCAKTICPNQAQVWACQYSEQ